MRGTKAAIVVGERVGNRVIVSEEPALRGCTRVLVRCDCGVEAVCYLTHFRKTLMCRSCSSITHGCSSATHGGSRGCRTPEYQSWAAMRQRCSPKNITKTKRYTQRGIYVVPRWCGDGGFENFLADMGQRPAGYSLDRIDNDGPYSPENCRWATGQEQNGNQSTSRRITAFGKEQSLAQWSRERGINRQTISWRIDSGQAPEEALRA